jgi:hypothetical protein
VSWRIPGTKENIVKKTLPIALAVTALSFIGVGEALAACTVCNGSSGKCYTFSTLNCSNFLLNTGDSCHQGLIATATGINLPARAQATALKVLAQRRIPVLQTTGSEAGRALIVVDHAVLKEASEALRRASIEFKEESIPQAQANRER